MSIDNDSLRGVGPGLPPLSSPSQGSAVAEKSASSGISHPTAPHVQSSQLDVVVRTRTPDRLLRYDTPGVGGLTPPSADLASAASACSQRSTAADGVALEVKSGMPVVDGQRPATWAETPTAFYRLAKALSGTDGGAWLAGLGETLQKQLLRTLERIAGGTALPGQAAGQLSPEEHRRLLLAAAKCLGALIGFLRDRETPMARQLHRDALLALTSLVAAQPAGATKAAMVSHLYRHCEDLPGELRDLVRPVMHEYVPVWAFESHAGGPGHLQPIHVSHFDTDEDGSVLRLSGPRVRIDLPREIAVKMDDFGIKPVESVPSPLPPELTPTEEMFAFAPDSPLSGAATAFYAATRVIDDADRWSGHEVAWGDGGQLTVVPYMFVTNYFNAHFDGRGRKLELGALGRVDAEKGLVGFTGTPEGWTKDVEDVFLDGARCRDIVAHEAGHAALNGLKPGLAYEMSMALNEAIADTVCCLTAFGDPDVVRRVLAETGGDLRQPNEATRMSEVIGQAKHRYGDDDPTNDDQRFVRSMLSAVTLEELGLPREGMNVPGMGFSPSRDPHLIGQVIAGAMYDVFAALYERELGRGHTPEEAIESARNVVGTLMLRSTRFIGEHMISFRDYAIALLRTERDLYANEHGDLLKEVLIGRRLVDAGEDIDALIRERERQVPELTLPPQVEDPLEVMRHLEEFEARQVRLALDAAKKGDRDAQRRVFLLRHNHYVPSIEKYKPEGLSLVSDTTSEDGVRVIRIAHKFNLGTLGNSENDATNAYKSLVFDSKGRLIDAHDDEPAMSAF